MKNGVLANINQQIDFETALIVADDLGIKIKKIHSGPSVEDLMERNLQNLLREEDASALEERSPVVSVMGHVDHGKTTLLDAIREANVVATEAGGITQHIGAYQVEKDGRKITFIDTPGHEAFTAMRARGAKATDIAILVVAADEGVKPQTIEAYNHAKEANIPVIVALNKIDQPGAQPDKVKAELTEIGLQPQEWGGSTMYVPLSALKKTGIDDLLASILLVAETLNLKANPSRPAVATVLESQLSSNFGPVATVVINTGILRMMDNVVAGRCYGRIKVMFDHDGVKIQKALPSMPVRIVGLSELPQMGDILQVVKDERTARSQALKIKTLQESALFFNKGLRLEEIATQIQMGDLRHLKLVVKADTKGSLEAIKQSLLKIVSERATPKIIHHGIGNISESDILMAQASRGIVIGFNVLLPSSVAKVAEREHVQVSRYSVIYKLVDDITNLLSGMIEPERVLVDLGKAEVLQIFYTKKSEMIVGCRVVDGKIERKAKLAVLRDGKSVGSGVIDMLKRASEDISEALKGAECGVKFTGDCQLKLGDLLQAYKYEMQKPTSKTSAV